MNILRIKKKVDPDTSHISELYLITPKYIKPWLSFIKEHYRLFETIVKRNNILPFKYSYKDLYKEIIDPIMDRFEVKEEKRIYINSFFIHGVLAIVEEWIKNGCKDSIDLITETINDCMFPTKNK